MTKAQLETWLKGDEAIEVMVDNWPRYSFIANGPDVNDVQRDRRRALARVMRDALLKAAKQAT